MRMPLINLRVNFYSCVVKSKTGEVKIFKKAESNDKANRARPENNSKDAEVILLPNDTRLSQNKQFSDTWGAFGKEWAFKYKGDYKALPTLNEMI